MTTEAWTSRELPSFEGRTVVVTGAKSGLGLATARRLAGAGARVILAVRNVATGAEARASISGNAEVRRLDLADLSSVRQFADEWTGDLDVLVNNAGVMHVPKGRTKDGFETQLGTNHLGPFVLTNLLLPHITDRVVTVSSLVHRAGSIDLEDLNWDQRRYTRLGAYAQSKLANLLFTLELERRLVRAGSSVRALAAHPGYASTNLQTRTQNVALDWLGKVGNLLFAQDAESGAWPTLYAASQDLPGGTYIGPNRLGESRGSPGFASRSAKATDAELARRLWETSETLTGVGFPDGVALR